MRLRLPASVVALLCPASGKAELISVFKGAGQLQAGKIAEDQLNWLEPSARPGAVGARTKFATNPMNCLSEAPGRPLPGPRRDRGRLKELKALQEQAIRVILM
ncbi:MAG: dihydroxy-acid dehydratase [Limisphaera sp.]|nr:dihydroxy-acid dehydratase [Limisphaera sp.]